MTPILNSSMLALIAFCIIAEAARELSFKSAANASTLRETMVKPMVWLGIFFWAIEIIAWTNVLEHTPLSIAFPLMSLSYVAIAFFSAAIFNEHIDKRHMLGALLITLGVACVGATGI